MRFKTIEVIVMLALGILLAPFAAGAQQPGKMPRIGWLSLVRADTPRSQYAREVIRQGLREFGWVEGQNITIEWRFAEERAERLPALAAELVRLGVDVLVTSSADQAILALRHATSTIPIIMAVSVAPVEMGHVASLARPGGNITGLSIQAAEVGGKRLELVKAAVPQASRVAVLWNAASPGKGLEWHDTQAAAHALGVTLYSVEVRGPDDFASAFAVIARERPDALITFADALTLSYQRQIVDFVTQHRLPMISEIKEFAEAGGLMTYGASFPALLRRAAYYVDRILKGAKPADLPVEQPTKFELVINLKTAQTLGITIPSSLLLLADEVIR
jgi:putative ABC transport system substrate-binding protein